jgi:hypothetical protein
VNTNIVDNLLHILPEIKIQGCQVRRTWGPLLPIQPLYSHIVPRDMSRNMKSGLITEHQRPHDFVEHARESPEVNVCCALTRDRVIGPYFCAERTVTSHSYLDMLELFAGPQIDDDNVTFQQDGAPAQYANIVTEFFDEIFPQRWIVRALMLSGPDTPGFLFLGVCEANCLPCSYSQHSTPETANQGSGCICRSRCARSSVAGNGTQLGCLQSHQWGPHRTSVRENSMAFSPQANYTDLATTACRRS